MSVHVTAGSVNAGASEHDLKFQSEVMKTTSTIVLEPVKLTRNVTSPAGTTPAGESIGSSPPNCSG